MPNTLAHVGVHVPFTRALVRAADAKWIYLGCVIPDLPWIFRRVLVTLPGVDEASIRLHAGAQASLMGSLVLAAAFACLACRPLRTLTVLGIGAITHLLLDACQIKWANGSLLFAPIDWRLVRFDLFWPEHPATYALTALGLVAFGYETLRTVGSDVVDVTFRPPRRLLGALVLVALWALWPLPFRDAALERDNYSLATLLAEERTGRTIEMDRAPYLSPPVGPAVVAVTGERLALTGPLGRSTSIVSLRGTFIDSTTIDVAVYHVHTAAGPAVSIRDLFSYAGLGLVGTSWLVALRRQQRRSRRPDTALR